MGVGHGAACVLALAAIAELPSQSLPQVTVRATTVTPLELKADSRTYTHPANRDITGGGEIAVGDPSTRSNAHLAFSVEHAPSRVVVGCDEWGSIGLSGTTSGVGPHRIQVVFRSTVPTNAALIVRNCSGGSYSGSLDVVGHGSVQALDRLCPGLLDRNREIPLVGEFDVVVDSEGLVVNLETVSGSAFRSFGRGGLLSQSFGNAWELELVYGPDRFVEHYSWDVSPVGQAGNARAAGAGDTNKDGYPDLIVGSTSGTGTSAVHSGKDGTKLWQIYGFSLGDELGASVAGAGDVNGDGFADVIVGAPQEDRDQLDAAGAVYVNSGVDGALLWRFRGSVVQGRMGFSVGGAGDVNGDGRADLIVGAPGPQLVGSVFHVGSAFVFSGRDGSQLYRFDGSDLGDDMGYSVAGAGDVNGDGFDDVVVGSPRTHPVGTGSAYVFSGADGTQIWKFESGVVGDWFGISVAGAGDVNRDGFADVIVGANKAGSAGNEFSGAALVYSGRDGSVLYRFDGAASDQLGYSVAGAGDVNRDGFDDVIVGALTDRAHFRRGGNEGSAHVFSGKDGARIWEFEGARIWAHLGLSVDGAGDVNLDGFPDVIVSDTESAFVHLYDPASLTYGIGAPGSGGVIPRIGTSGSIPEIGRSFQIQVTEAVGGALCVLGGSTAPAALPLAGGTVYIDYLTPGAFLLWGLVTSGAPGAPGAGTATLPITIPNDPSLVSFTTYWQGVVFDAGSALPAGVSHTGGLAVTIVR